VLIACATHWYSSLAFAAPVVGIAGWLKIASLREARRSRSEPPTQGRDRPGLRRHLA
jgi:hypothetical protein